MTKIAAKKTAGLVGDDLALNAEQVTGVKPNRELPVIWAVAKGSFVNKLINLSKDKEVLMTFNTTLLTTSKNKLLPVLSALGTSALLMTMPATSAQAAGQYYN